MGRLDGKVAIVTGGVSGIGKGTVEAFVAEGARVYVGDVNEDGIGAMVSSLGHNYVDGLKVDIRDEDAVQRMVAGCVKRFGRLDIAFNNAGRRRTFRRSRITRWKSSAGSSTSA